MHDKVLVQFANRGCATVYVEVPLHAVAITQLVRHVPTYTSGDDFVIQMTPSERFSIIFVW